VSINVPVTEGPGKLPPVSLCPMNTHGMIDSFQRNTNPLGETYFWSSGTPMEFHETEAGSDVQCLLAGHVTVTPLTFDLTDRKAMERWKGKALGSGQ
jgi:5'-nucleotidase